MDECQNVIDFEELEKLCSSEIYGDQENNLQLNKNEKTENNNSNYNNNKKRETKEIEVQTEAFDEKDFDNICDVDPQTDYTSIDNMGQTESKRGTKVKGPETKGTAMSFGFKKKSVPVYTGTTKKVPLKQDKLEASDDNGNTGESKIYFYRKYFKNFIVLMNQRHTQRVVLKIVLLFHCNRVNGFSAR